VLAVTLAQSYSNCESSALCDLGWIELESSPVSGAGQAETLRGRVRSTNRFNGEAS
jgi:hypothetical protein